MRTARPEWIKTRIFLDSGNPEETREVLGLLGFLDGQTTNPTLIAKNPKTKGRKFTKKEIFDFYRDIVIEISELIPAGSVSIEAYADEKTSSQEMFEQGMEMFSWIPNAHIKFPTTLAGLEAANKAVKAGLRVNMTLCFSQEQAGAVYIATQGAQRGSVFVSPFVGRLDDKGINGMSLIANIARMFEAGDKHVELLVSSVRNLQHVFYSLRLGSDIATVPFGILREWVDTGLAVPGRNYRYPKGDLRDLNYEQVSFARNWYEFNVEHELTRMGIKKFADDWNALIDNCR